MDISCLSQTYRVRVLKPEDVEDIFELSRGNRIFYQYHPPFVTRESILEDMEALPPGKEYKDKFYVGFFSGEQLVAVMDLILGFPEENIAWIGLFMLDVRSQGRGTGTRILRDCLQSLRETGMETVRLAVDRGNPQSSHFWQKNGFSPIAERENYIIYERN